MGLTDGERWTGEALQGLRAGGYRPRAWARFLAESSERAAETRRERPELARQSRRWGAAGAAAWLARSRLAGGRPGPTLAGLGWWALVCKMVDWHLGMVEGPQGEPRGRLTAADALTLARFWLTPLAASPSTRSSFASLVGAGAVSDVMDGRLATRRGPTRLGRDLDTVADIAFFGAAVSRAARQGWLRPRAAAWLGARFGASLGFVTCHYFVRATPPPRASGRWASPLLVTGLLAAAAGRPRAAEALLVAGATLPLAWQAHHLRLQLADSKQRAEERGDRNLGGHAAGLAVHQGRRRLDARSHDHGPAACHRDASQRDDGENRAARP